MPPTTTPAQATERRLVRPWVEQVDTRSVARIAQRDRGVVSIDELRTCGLSDDAVAKLVEAGWLHPVHRGVYAVGHPNLTLEGRFMAAVKACGPVAVLSHVAAAVLWGLLTWDHRAVEVTVTTKGTRLHEGVRTHRTGRLEEVDQTRLQGIPITCVARTIIDCAAVLGPDQLRRMVREAQARRLVTIGELAEILIRLGPRRGSRRLALLISTGPAPTRSELEDAVLDLLLHGGLAHPDVNVPLEIKGRRVVPDFRWPAQRLVVEADGAAWHDRRLAREDDAERQAILEAHGERVLRVTWDQAMRRPAQTLTRLRAAGVPPA